MPFSRGSLLVVALSSLVACAPSGQIDGVEPEQKGEGGGGGDSNQQGENGSVEGGTSGNTTPSNGGQGGQIGGTAGAAGQAGGGGASGAGGVVTPPVPEGSPIIVALGDGGFTLRAKAFARPVPISFNTPATLK